MKIVDLHTHTTASDGSYTPTELVKYAKQKGLSAIAITDHDTVAGVEEASMEGEELGIRVIPGAELSRSTAQVSVQGHTGICTKGSPVTGRVYSISS